jgi:Tfp pilus assembly protein PilF
MLSWLKKTFVSPGEIEQSGSAVQLQVALEPGQYEQHIAHGDNAMDLGDHEASAECYRRAIQAKPDYFEGHYKLGNALLEQGEIDAAIACYRHSIVLEPDFYKAHFNLGNACYGQKKLDEAIACYRETLRLQHDFAGACVSLGNALYDQGQLDEAASLFRRALQLAPHQTEVYTNLGDVLQDQGDLDAAIECYVKTTQARPDYDVAHWQEGLCRLKAGQFEIGWEKYEWRWKTISLEVSRMAYVQPLWLGKESLKGRTILLHAEQGFGDTIQLCRYVKLVAARGAKVLLAAPSHMRPLLQTLEAECEIFIEGQPLPAFDFHCPLMSLPLAFNTRLDTIPVETSYLRSDPARDSVWRERIGAKTKPRIGVAWSGRQEHKNDHNRSIPLAQFARLFTGRAQFFSLQKEVRDTEMPLLGQSSVTFLGDQLSDYADTAALISQLDLVITVDTSVAHLAGALGKPVWIMVPYNPDWRWLLKREDSPWYPSARIFRQTQFGNWQGIVEEVAERIDEWARGANPQA